MKRNEVMQAYYIHKEIAMWEEKLAQLRENSEAKANPTYLQGGRSENLISDPTGTAGAKYTEVEAIIEGLTAEAKIAEKNIVIFINTLKDSLSRQIVFYRCVEFLPWRKVAQKIGGGNTEDGVRKRFDRMFPAEK